MRHRLTPQQQLLNNSGWFGSGQWFLPNADSVDVPRDRTAPPAGRPVTVPDALKGTVITSGSVAVTGPAEWTLAGIPMQSVGPFDNVTNWTIGSTDYGYVTWKIRTPSEVWVEGMPRTRVWFWQDAPGAWDRHAIFVGPETVVEMIGVDVDRNTAEKAVEWSKDGRLVRQFPAGGPVGVCRGEVPMHRYVLTRRSLTDPHVLGLVVPNAVAGANSDGSLADGTFPRYGQHVYLEQIPLGLTGEALKVAEILKVKGARVVDISRNKECRIWVQPGAQWAGSNLARLSVPLSALSAG